MGYSNLKHLVTVYCGLWGMEYGVWGIYLWPGPPQRSLCIHREGYVDQGRCHQRTGDGWSGTC